MRDIEAEKFYVRYRDELPDSDAQAYAVSGFKQLNVEVVPFYWADDIRATTDLGPTVGVAGFIGDVHAGLLHLGKPIPPNVDYPEELREYVGRSIVEGTLGDVRARPGTPRFIKPQEHKAFSGFVWNGDAESRRRVVTMEDETPIFHCEPVTFLSEYRSFILYGQVIDCRKYRGDWSVAPNKDIVLGAPKKLGKRAPHAYCLDWGVADDGRTLLVEMNEGFSFGHYGLPAVSYARMLSARWMEMTSP